MILWAHHAGESILRSKSQCSRVSRASMDRIAGPAQRPDHTYTPHCVRVYDQDGKSVTPSRRSDADRYCPPVFLYETACGDSLSPDSAGYAVYGRVDDVKTGHERLLTQAVRVGNLRLGRCFPETEQGHLRSTARACRLHSKQTSVPRFHAHEEITATDSRFESGLSEEAMQIDAPGLGDFAGQGIGRRVSVRFQAE